MRLAIALLVIASACGHHDSPLSITGSGSAAPVGSGAPASPAADPWAKPPGDAPCDDASIRRHVEDSLAASVAYLSALEKRTARWTLDCEAARKDLLALEPDAEAFMAAMRTFVEWGRTLPSACGKRVGEIGDQLPATHDVEARTPALEAKVKPVLEHCTDHPGFQDAAAKGLRLLRRKKS